MKTKVETVVSPIGTAAYSWLTKADTAFGQNHFKVTLMLDKDDKDNKAFVDKVNKIHKGFANGKKTASPIKDGDASDKEELAGKWSFTAKTQYAPKLVDTKRQQLSGNTAPMSGDLIRVAMGLAGYDTGANAGVSLRLKAVQLVEKRNAGGDVGDVFDDIDGYVAEEAESVEPEDDDDF
tara:strand:+ start:2237 stop:2773 length:537 start_codon:yes stop_codon:yes gene_type:complete